MTKSCVVSQSRPFVNLHEFLKRKRGIVKYAKKTFPNNINCNELLKHYGIFDPLTVKQLHGSFWVGDYLIRKRGPEIIFLAKNTQATTEFPSEIVIKSSPIEYSSSLQHLNEVLSKLASCNNVVRCHGTEITTSNSGQKIYNLMFEHCSGSSLRDHMINYGLDGLPELEVRRYARDIVRGLYYMHCHARYIHGDIKPRNILLVPRDDEKDSFEAKIGSFGMAKKLCPDVIYDNEMRGSCPYESPELARDGCLDWPGDIWSVGCVVLEMLMGKRSFNDVNEYSELPKISEEISNVGKDFLKKCLIKSPYKRRPTWLLIKHPFVDF